MAWAGALGQMEGINDLIRQQTPQALTELPGKKMGAVEK